MPKFVYTECPCGHRLRAWADQGGTTIRCWSCHREVPVPFADPTGRLVRGLGDALTGVLGPSTAVPLLLGSAALTALLLVPAAGPALALAALAAACALGYGGQVRAGASRVQPVGLPPGRPAAPDDPPEGAVEESTPPLRRRVATGVLAVVAVLALVAPVAVRNQGHALPPGGATAGVLPRTALALVGWLVMPVALLAAHAPGGRTPARALAVLARHPLATLVALLVLPAGLAATELFVALVGWEQGQLPLLVADLFPVPRLVQELDGAHMLFNYDGATFDVKCADRLDAVASLYPQGLRRGFTLAGGLPASLSRRPRMAEAFWFFETTEGRCLSIRMLLTLITLWAVAVVVTVQARWLGVIAAIDPRPQPRADARPAGPVPASEGDPSSLTR